MHEVRLSWYAYAEGHSRHSLCYNGELNTVKNIQEMQQRFPQTDCWMIGRGMIANPGLLMELEAEKLKNEKKIQSYGGFSIEKERMAAFLEDICIHYEEADKISCCIINSSTACYRCIYDIFRSYRLGRRRWNMGIL